MNPILKNLQAQAKSNPLEKLKAFLRNFNHYYFERTGEVLKDRDGRPIVETEEKKHLKFTEDDVVDCEIEQDLLRGEDRRDLSAKEDAELRIKQE